MKKNCHTNNNLKLLKTYLALGICSISTISFGQSIGKYLTKAGTDFKVNAVAATHNNYYYLCGSVNSPNTSTNSNVYIAKLDAKANPVFQKNLNITSFKDAAFDAVKTYDGGMLVVGYAGHRYNAYYRSLNGIPHTTNNSDIFVSKYSSSGNLLFQKTIGSGFNDYAYSVTQKSFLDYYIAGNSYNSVYNVMNISLTQISEFGIVMDNAIIQTSGLNKKSYSTKKIIKLSDGSFVIMADEVTDKETETDLGHPREKYIKYRKASAIQLVMLDNSGAITQCKRLTFNGTIEVTSSDIIQTNDGNLFITGTVKESEDEDILAFALKTTPTGDVIDTRSISLGFGNSVFPNTILYNGSKLQIVGYYGLTYQSYGDFWISMEPDFVSPYDASTYEDIISTSGCITTAMDSAFVAGVEESTSTDRVSLYKIKMLNFSSFCSRYLGAFSFNLSCVSTDNTLVKSQVSFQENSHSVNAALTTNEIIWCNSSYRTASTKPQVDSEPIRDTEIKVFPNPAIDNITIQFPATEEKISYTLYNVMGQIISSGEETNTHSFPINLNGHSGVYFLHINSSAGKEIIKITTTD